MPAPGVNYFHRNQVNSTTIVSNAAGAVVANVEYLPFGEISKFTGPDTFRPKFAGRERDVETGLYDFGARYYLPQIARFITADDRLGGPLEKHDALNAYAYVLNSPVCNVDPSGHSIWSAIEDAVGTVGLAMGKGFTWMINNPKDWAPWVLNGLMIIGGVAILATTPFGGAASAMLGGMLLGAGISGMGYSATHLGDKFEWGHWGIQVGIGGAVGLVSGGLGFGATAAANALQAGGNAAFALGATGRVALMAATGAIDGAAASAFTTAMTNLEYGREAKQGVGWAALVGGITGGLGSGLGAKAAGKFTRPAARDGFELLDRLERHGFNPAMSRVPATDIISKQLAAMLERAMKVAKGAGMYFGADITW